MAFHPQTDGLSERKNQWVEQYLHLVANAQQGDWSQWLTVASAVHNDHVNSTLGVTPIEVLLGYRPTLHPSQNTTTSNQTAEQRIKTLHQKRAQAITAINKVANQKPDPRRKVQRRRPSLVGGIQSEIAPITLRSLLPDVRDHSVLAK